MKIACLGWGSLTWDPRDLPIRREWFLDGPFAPVEFRRKSSKSSDSRITLVIDPEAAPVRVLWAHMLPADLPAAKEALRSREGLTSKEWERDIGVWKSGDAVPDTIPDLPIWAKTHGLDAAIWTALGPKLDDIASPSADQVINYLRKLTGPARDYAERYIRCAPRQIDTDYRRRIEAELGWSHRACSGEPMPATKVEEELLYYTGRAGDIVRQLGFAALAAVWLFHSAASSPTALPVSFKCAVILVVASLTVDAVQYVVGSLLWGAKILKDKGEEAAAKQRGTVRTLLAIVTAKVVLMLVAYLFLLRALASQVRWG